MKLIPMLMLELIGFHLFIYNNSNFNKIFPSKIPGLYIPGLAQGLLDELPQLL